jgi:hypothetical protein
LLFRLFLKPVMVEQARAEADRGLQGKMEGHAEMDMAVTEGPILKRIRSDQGRTAISQYFVMDWLAVWKDVIGGLLIAGACCMGSDELLEILLLEFAPGVRKILGSTYRSLHRHHCFCVLGG